MNDNQVFEQAVAPHTRGLYAFIRYLNRWACDDIYQETMLAAWQGFHSLREQGSLRAWLYGIARRKAMDAYRKRYRQDAWEASWEDTMPAAGFEGQAVQRLDIAQALGTLQPQDRALLYLVFNVGFPYKAAGQVMGIPEGTVKSRVFTLKKRLKALMGEEGQHG